ncbi:MAG TPA: peptidoglycan recognition family protein [Tepidisphaeraceae bacterium]|nr:peptidoglycan recognition family protein [Tepidisphaeraceae bacterium]
MSRRNVAVLASLLGSLVLTSGLLLVVAPAPLTPDAAQRLFATDQYDSLERIFDTEASIKPGRWQAIYIHHSKSRAGNALDLAGATGGMGDHFLIGNGNGCADGEIQVGQRWTSQHAAKPANGKQPLPQLAAASDNYIGICLVGDFDQAAPTAAQMQRLEQLVQALQRKLAIPGKAILAFDRPGNAGIGRQFPAVAFSERILP